MAVIDAAHISNQRDFSLRTFGPGPRTQGVVDHIRKELVEVLREPYELDEWVDVIILGFDGAWRAGHEPQTIIDAIKAKQAKNERRNWPAWKESSTEIAIEHVRERPNWDDYFLGIAKAVATRADCRRAQHGAVIVDSNNRVVSTGYNGSPAGGKSCLAGECERGLKTYAELPPNSSDYSDCIALHAEQNAIAYADRSRSNGGTIYITAPPCDMCSKLIHAAGITRVVTYAG